MSVVELKLLVGKKRKPKIEKIKRGKPCIKIRKQTTIYQFGEHKIRICDISDDLLMALIRGIREVADDTMETMDVFDYKDGSLNYASTELHKSLSELTPERFATLHIATYRYMLLDARRRGLELTQAENVAVNDVYFALNSEYIGT